MAKWLYSLLPTMNCIEHQGAEVDFPTLPTVSKGAEYMRDMCLSTYLNYILASKLRSDVMGLHVFHDVVGLSETGDNNDGYLYDGPIQGSSTDSD